MPGRERLVVGPREAPKADPRPVPDVHAKDNHVVAVCCGDIHLSDEPPIARRVQGVDWYKTQANYLDQVHGLCERHGAALIISGDVFDDGWRPKKCPPRLINLAIEHLPKFTYGVPGQHDLQNHRLDQLRRSAFWTLVKSGKLTYLEPDRPIHLPWMSLHGFPWGVEPKPLREKHSLALQVAVVHKYVWVEGAGHSGAKPDAHLNSVRRRLRGFDIACIGDNHTPVFKPHKTKCSVVGCGSFMRRRRDELEHWPWVGLILANGKVKRHYLDVSGDQFADTPRDNKGAAVDAASVVAELTALGEAALDFADALRRYREAHGLDDSVWELVLKWRESK